MVEKSFVRLVTRPASVCSLASGNPATAPSRAVVASSLSPPLMFTKVKRFLGLAKVESKLRWLMLTGPSI